MLHAYQEISWYRRIADTDLPTPTPVSTDPAGLHCISILFTMASRIGMRTGSRLGVESRTCVPSSFQLSSRPKATLQKHLAVLVNQHIAGSSPALVPSSPLRFMRKPSPVAAPAAAAGASLCLIFRK